MRTPAWLKPACAVAALSLALCLLGAGRASQDLPNLPPIIFVSRGMPTGADAGQIPGLGPHGSTIIVGGRLLIRESSGAVRELVPHEKFTDVQDPDISPDARRVVFSAVAPGEKHWDLWSVGVDGSGLVRLPTDLYHEGSDSVDPCWYAGGIVFVKAQPSLNLYDNGPRSQLAIRLADGTSEVLGGTAGTSVLDPCVDARTGRLLFSRWWYNPWRADSLRKRTEPGARVHPADEVNLWQPVTASVITYMHGDSNLWDGPGRYPGPHTFYDLRDLRLAAGGIEPRRASTAVQCVRLRDGTLVGTGARNTGLAPTPGATFVQRFARPPSPGQRIAGAAIANDDRDAYAEGENLQPATACCPGPLPDGGLLISLDRGGRGDFGLYAQARDGSVRRVVDLPGTLELDAIPVVSRRDGEIRAIGGGPWEFRFLDRDIFAGSGALPRSSGTHLTVYELHESLFPGDTPEVHAVKSVAVPITGRVDIALPAGRAMFETLTDSLGHVLMTAHGPAQVRGFNSGAPGSTVTCRGCHLGHSTLR